jgi:hypothetical protein
MLLATPAGLAQTGAKKNGPTPQQYVARLGGELVPPAQLVLDGRRMSCGSQPTVLDKNLNDAAAAYPKFTILNPNALLPLTSTVKFWVYNHACGRQIAGRDPNVADCFAVKRGVQEGWLSPQGMDEICEYIRPARRSEEHPTGAERCRRMRKCFSQGSEARQ